MRDPRDEPLIFEVTSEAGPGVGSRADSAKPGHVPSQASLIGEFRAKNRFGESAACGQKTARERLRRSSNLVSAPGFLAVALEIYGEKT